MAWNVFKYCTSLRWLGSLMILIVLTLAAFTYYTIVLTVYGPILFRGGRQSLIALPILLLFHALLVMLLWSYFAVVFTDPGHVPFNWRPEISDADFPLVDSSGLPPEFGRIRYCRKCNHYKPPRSHHCSACGRCVLKMDHHCIWVVNCVGALNYKYFLLFLFYTFFETTLVALSLLPYFMAFFTDEEISESSTTLAVSFIAFVLDLVFALSILGFLIMHIWFVAANTSTIEACEIKTTPKWHYDLGWRRNYEQVFGTNKRYWFIPAYSEEDLKKMPALHGLEFPIDPDLEALQLQQL